VAAFVLDASVLAALYVDDPASDESEAFLARLERAGGDVHAPELVLLEVANVLWKRVRAGQLDPADAMTAIADLSSASIRLHPAPSIVRSALALAMAHGLSAYDAAYCAVATRVGATVITHDADLRRRAAAAGIPVAGPTDRP
jgi:predicted nucleic acid-binding protein